jgi:hypothetical protein
MATIKELEILTEEGISCIVSQITNEILEVELDGEGRLEWKEEVA